MSLSVDFHTVFWSFRIFPFSISRFYHSCQGKISVWPFLPNHPEYANSRNPFQQHLRCITRTLVCYYPLSNIHPLPTARKESEWICGFSAELYSYDVRTVVYVRGVKRKSFAGMGCDRGNWFLEPFFLTRAKCCRKLENNYARIFTKLEVFRSIVGMRSDLTVISSQRKELLRRSYGKDFLMSELSAWR